LAKVAQFEVGEVDVSPAQAVFVSQGDKRRVDITAHLFPQEGYRKSASLFPVPLSCLSMAV
jgi:hypothetical protein